MIVTADAGILARATFRSNGPARRLLQEIAGSPFHDPIDRFFAVDFPAVVRARLPRFQPPGKTR
jgi:hypothetical protein